MFKNIRIRHLDYLPLIFFSFVLYKAVSKSDVIMHALINFFDLLSPFIWAFTFSYLLNPLMRDFEKRFNLKRGYSILLTYSIVIGVIAITITTIIPGIVASMAALMREMPNYIEVTEDWLNELLVIAKQYGIDDAILENFTSMIENASSYINLIIKSTIDSLIDITSTLLRLFLGLVISIYLLVDKEKFAFGIKKILRAFLSDQKVYSIIEFSKEVDEVFSKYIIGKIIDSVIVGIICFVGLMIIDAPFVLLLSVIVGITNMIPYFGPIIGAVPAVLITLFYSPIKALWVTIFILILQQLDGWLLGPFILGDKVGVKPFWIMLAIVIGGGTFGVWGMLLGVPVLVIIKRVVERQIDKRLECRQ